MTDKPVSTTSNASMLKRTYDKPDPKKAGQKAALRRY